MVAASATAYNVASGVTTLDVMREFTYPMGIGTFDFYSYPAKTLITRVEHIGNRIFMTANVDIAVREQRNHRIVRMPLQRDTLRGMLPIRPETHFMVIADDGKVAASGHAERERVHGMGRARARQGDDLREPDPRLDGH